MAKAIKVEYVPLSTIRPYENNPRKNDKAIAAVTNSIVEFGFLNPIIVDGDRIIICGHTRFLAAQRLRMDTVPVIVADDLTEEQAAAFRIADNKTSEIATWDMDKLHEELAELKGIFAMDKFGFKEELEGLKKDLKQKQHKCPKCGYEW